MPIRINLLAEAQALEEMRRRDPVKRAIWVGILIVLGMLVWSSSLQLKSMMARSDLNRLEGQMASRSSEYKAVLEKQRRLADANLKVTKLQELARTRLLYGNMLNALQQNTIDDVQLTRFKAEQNYFLADEVKAKTNADGHITPAKPPTSTEKIVVMLDARDSGPNPGDQVNKFKQILSDSSYFSAVLGRSNEMRLASLAPPSIAPDTKPFVQFTLECRYPERTR
jgi:hypothetical protein